MTDEQLDLIHRNYIGHTCIDELLAEVRALRAQRDELANAVDQWMRYAEVVCDGMPGARIKREFQGAVALSNIPKEAIAALVKVKP